MSEKLEKMKKAAKVVGLILSTLKKGVKAGVCGEELDIIAKKIMEDNNVKSSSLNYGGFPANICVSVSNSEKSELTHGIPTKKPFSKGDLVSIDVACYYQDEKGEAYHADAALTTIVDEIDNEIKNNLLNVTKECLGYVINQIKPNLTTTKDIGAMIEKYVRSRGYYVIKKYGGHGIGNILHEKPFIPNYKIPGKGQIIHSGMFICIEPLVQMYDDRVTTQTFTTNNKDWEVVISSNGFLNAHFEHMLYVNEKRAIVLTEYENV